MKTSRYKKASSRIAKRNKSRKIFSLFIKIGAPVAFLAGFIFLARADFLQVKSFEILGAETMSAEKLTSAAQSLTLGSKFLLIPKSNIFLLNKNNLANILLSDFSRIEKIEINKQLFSQKVEIKITERKGDFLWCRTSGECFNMTKDGLVFASPDGALAKSGKVIFRGVLGNDPLMKNFATAEKMQNYENLIETFKKSGFEIISINIESDEKGAAETSAGSVIFDPSETDLSVVAQNAILLINQTKSKNPTARFEYIDARFGNKLFYKLY